VTGRARTGMLAVAAVGLLTYGLADDLVTQVRLHHTQVDEAATRVMVTKSSAQLANTDRTLALVTSRQQVEQTTVNAIAGELATAQERLAEAKQGLALQNLNLASLGTCVSGVQQAVADLEAGHQQQAIATIGGAAASCQNLQSGGPGGPVYPFDFPDPDVIDAGGTYFAYATNAAGGNIQIIESTDLAHWTTVGDALPKLASWASPGSTWAPGVVHRGGRFLLYYTALDPSAPSPRQCISVAVASRPQGPFTDSTSAPLVCQSSLGGSIDPAPYTGPTGKPYLVWKSNGGSGQPATIWAEALASSGTALARRSTPVALLQPSQPWEGSVVEGPFMWSAPGGGYDLFYSANNWNSASYAIGVAVCSGPLGACAKPLPGPLYASQPTLEGPGGPSVFADSAGNAWLAFHAWLPGAVGYPNARLLFMRPLASLSALPSAVPGSGKLPPPSPHRGHRPGRNRAPRLG
jgi:hypothetical protein